MADLSSIRFADLFTTPLVTHVWQDGAELNPALRAAILGREAERPGAGRSNHGGWHSEVGELEFCGEAGRRLVTHMRALAEEATRRVFARHGRNAPGWDWSVYAWANVNRSGDFNKIHVHPASTWSGTYYVDAGDPADQENGTPLHLFDPCQGRTMSFLTELPSSVYVRPRAGLMVLFPSYVPHMVFPHAGRTERISIAFNLRKEPYP
jgi:uncharacterized protein (TIGR02466 family)